MDDDVIRRGDFYEDCGFHPRLCVEVNYEDDELWGISLLNGGLGSCSPANCGPERITVDEAIERRRRHKERIREWYGEQHAQRGEAPATDGLGIAVRAVRVLEFGSGSARASYVEAYLRDVDGFDWQVVAPRGVFRGLDAIGSGVLPEVLTLSCQIGNRSADGRQVRIYCLESPGNQYWVEADRVLRFDEDWGPASG